MAQITIEYMILMPVLVIQIFIFPYTATVIMDAWADSRRTIELQEVTGHLGSSIQQLYYTINHASIVNGTMKLTLDLPLFIENHAYTVNLGHITSDDPYELMNVTLSLIGTTSRASTVVTLGDNVDWAGNLSFNSTTTPSILTATKTLNEVILTHGGA